MARQPVQTTIQSSLAYRAHLHVGHVAVSRCGVEKNEAKYNKSSHGRLSLSSCCQTLMDVWDSQAPETLEVAKELQETRQWQEQ